MSRNRYDDEFRSQAVALLEAAGYPDTPGALTRVSEQVDVPLSTLSRWFKGTSNPPPSKIVNEKRFDLLDAIRGELVSIFGTLPEARSGASYKDLATAAAILIDKLQLLTGSPTERTEQTGVITVEYRDEGGLKLDRPTWQDDAERLMQ